MKRKYEHQNTSSSDDLTPPKVSFWNKKMWSHVELGAANYGQNVDADSSYFSKGTLSRKQHTILFMTVDELIKNKGKRGIIYINDLNKKLVNYTISCLRKYIMHMYPEAEIWIKPLVGDFFKIAIPMVTSIHLKNPEHWFFESLGEECNKNRLNYFAEHAKEGLVLVTYYKNDFLKQVSELGISYSILDLDFSPYIHADGTPITSNGKVVKFSIRSLNKVGGRLRSHSTSDLQELIQIGLNEALSVLQYDYNS